MIKKREAHVSIDDVHDCIIRLGEKGCSSIFDDPFFSYLQKQHERWGCKFSLYCFADIIDTLIKHSSYLDEFRNNQDWLKIGFHAESGLGRQPTERALQQFKDSYSKFENILRIRKLSSCQILRLDYFYATDAEVYFLKEQGVKCLLCSDDRRTSYNLTSEEAAFIRKKGCLLKNGIYYQRTTCRTERHFSYIILIYKLIIRHPIILFTHETLLSGWNKIKFALAIMLLSISRYRFYCK